MTGAILQESSISIERSLRFVARSSLRDSAKQAMKKNPRHQWRIKATVLREASFKLQKGQPSVGGTSRISRAAHEIGQCASFDELLGVIDQNLGFGHGLGDLSKYDIAHRIGAHLGLYPNKVYLHRGTRAGAEALGLNGKLGTLEVSSLPREFRRLRPDEIEDCLCIYKGELASLAQGKFPAANHASPRSCTSPS